MAVASGRIGSIEERSAQLAIELRVADLAGSIAFYAEAGFALERRTIGFAAMQIDGRYLLLSETPAAVVGPNPPNLRISVADVDAAFAGRRRWAGRWRMGRPTTATACVISRFATPMATRFASRRCPSYST